MNKNGMNSSVGNYLTNASLFKNGQKNRLVSSYVTHRSYFAQEERGNPAINVPNMTKSKKQHNFPYGDHVVEAERTDSIKATVKKEVQGYSSMEGSNKMESKIQEEHELKSIKEEISREVEVSSANNRENVQRSLHQLNRQVDSESATKIVVNYSKPSSEKEKMNQNEDYAETVEKPYPPMRESIKASKLVKPMVDPNRQKKEQPQPQTANPYLPSSTKKPQQAKLYQIQNGELILRQIQSSNFNHATPISSMGVAHSPREQFYLTHSSIQPKKQPQPQQTQEMDYFLHIRKDLVCYLASVKQKLNGSCICLETIQYQFDGLIDKVLQLQCQKLKTALYRMVDQQIQDFRQFQRRQFLKNKFYLMSDLYQIKCNIDLRLQQLQHFQLQLKNQYKWKDTVTNIIGINYNENVNFLLRKSDQIQKDIIGSIDMNVAEYVRVVNQELAGGLRRALKEEIANFYQTFSEAKWKSRLRTHKVTS